MTNTSAEAADVLRAIGMHPKYKGYAYLFYILRLTQLHPEYLYSVSRMLYESVMKQYTVSIASVERNIRFAIRKTWDDGNQKEITRLFGAYDTGYVPTNREFIAVLTECIMQRRFEAQEPMQLSLTMAL